MSVTPEAIQASTQRNFFSRLSPFDWLWGLLVLAGSAFAISNYHDLMDSYEEVIMGASAIGLIAFGWLWKPMRQYSLAVAAISLLAVWSYGTDLSRGEEAFFLKFLLASQSAIAWMSALFVLATLAYYLSIILRSDYSARVASALTWSGTVMGAVGLMVRWRETYLMGLDVGHIPVSNLYEVFILFSVITAMLYLHYERSYRNRGIGAFVLTVVSASVIFLLWYSYTRDAHIIRPLIPALQSYWMKIHVPANFVGYGAFALAAMLGMALLGRHYSEHPNRLLLWILLGLVALQGFGLKAAFLIKAGGAAALISAEGLLGMLTYAVVGTLFLAALAWVLTRKRVAAALPSEEVIDDIIYKAIALGFAFFTVATVLGAMWAAEAWGGYWSWDPKETWALIVWLNYAAWLHLRLTKGWRGRPLAWWAIVGLFVTLFAFLGVNMFLTGLHSYGTL